MIKQVKIPVDRIICTDCVRDNIKRIISVGDIHGCFDSLLFHLNELKITENDILIFLGDYIDRGPNSPMVIEFLINLQKDRVFKDLTLFLRGNHEAMFMDFLKLDEENRLHSGSSAWLNNGAEKTLQQYRKVNLKSDYISSDSRISDKNKLTLDNFNIPQSHAEFLLQTLLYADFEHAFYSHAGFDVPAPINYLSQMEDQYVWTRSRFLEYNHIQTKVNKLVIHGHTINSKTHLPSWDVKQRKINLDSGCFISGNLSSHIHYVGLQGPGRRDHLLITNHKEQTTGAMYCE